jgi:hypothetical protein
MRLRIALLSGFLLASTCTVAQELPPPSRTVFKCKNGAKIVYSDSPCLGAEKIDVEPTRGLNAASAHERIGPDVQRELRREGIANAVRPISGMDAKQFEVAGRRIKLTAAAQRECRELDKDIPAAELEEKQAAAATLPSIQERLFVLRSRYRDLRC